MSKRKRKPDGNRLGRGGQQAAASPENPFHHHRADSLPFAISALIHPRLPIGVPLPLYPNRSFSRDE